MEKLTEQDKKRCIEFLKSFIDEDKTVDELQEITSFMSNYIWNRKEFLVESYKLRLERTTVKDLLTALPAEAIEYSNPHLVARLQAGKDADEGCGKELSEPK